MTKRLVLVAGNIASGKTSLTERLGSRLGWYLSLIHISEPTRLGMLSRMPSSA